MKKISVGLLIILCLLSLAAMACTGWDSDIVYKPSVTVEADPVEGCVTVSDGETAWVECEDD